MRYLTALFSVTGLLGTPAFAQQLANTTSSDSS